MTNNREDVNWDLVLVGPASLAITLLAVMALLALTGCAGRAPQPVAIVQAQDRYLDCPAIMAEGQANNAKLTGLAGEQSAKATQNIAAGVAGLFIWPLWFAMDFQGSAKQEVTALQSRQQYLGTLAEQKHCGIEQASS